jgi:hypothetical protein
MARNHPQFAPATDLGTFFVERQPSSIFYYPLYFVLVLLQDRLFQLGKLLPPLLCDFLLRKFPRLPLEHGYSLIM